MKSALPIGTIIIIITNNMVADHEAEAKSMFQHLVIKVVNGYCFLGGFIGDRESTKQFLDNKITGWVNNLLKLSKAAESQPQAAFAALSKSMQFEWSYLQRILPSCEEAFTPIWNTLYHYSPCQIDNVYPPVIHVLYACVYMLRIH